MGGGDSRRSPRHGHRQEGSAGARTRQPPPRGALSPPGQADEARAPLEPALAGTSETRPAPGRSATAPCWCPTGESHSGLLPPGLDTWGLLPPTTASPSEAEPELLPGRPRDRAELSPAPSRPPRLQLPPAQPIPRPRPRPGTPYPVHTSRQLAEVVPRGRSASLLLWAAAEQRGRGRDRHPAAALVQHLVVQFVPAQPARRRRAHCGESGQERGLTLPYPGPPHVGQGSIFRPPTPGTRTALPAPRTLRPGPAIPTLPKTIPPTCSGPSSRARRWDALPAAGTLPTRARTCRQQRLDQHRPPVHDPRAHTSSHCRAPLGPAAMPVLRQCGPAAGRKLRTAGRGGEGLSDRPAPGRASPLPRGRPAGRDRDRDQGWGPGPGGFSSLRGWARDPTATAAPLPLRGLAVRAWGEKGLCKAQRAGDGQGKVRPQPGGEEGDPDGPRGPRPRLAGARGGPRVLGERVHLTRGASGERQDLRSQSCTPSWPWGWDDPQKGDRLPPMCHCTSGGTGRWWQSERAAETLSVPKSPFGPLCSPSD